MFCDADNSLGNRQNHFPALNNTWTGNEDERVVAANSYVTNFHDQEIISGEHVKRSVYTSWVFNVRKNGTTNKKTLILLRSCISSVIDVF
jgi:hypothetical protein